MKKPLTLPRDRTALLCIDLQEEHRRDPRFLVAGYDAIVARVAALQAAARANAVPVLHCAFAVDPASAQTPPLHPLQPDGRSVFSHKDDPLTAISPELAPASGESVLVKSRASAFSNEDLHAALMRGGIEWLVVAGVWTEACVDATVRDAVLAGFRVLLVKDACGSGTAAMHQTAILNLANRLYGGAVVAAADAVALLSGETTSGWMLEGAVPFRYDFTEIPELYESL